MTDTRMLVVSVEHFGADAALLRLRADGELPPIKAGQFVNVLAPKRAGVLLRRPISVCNADSRRGELWLLVKNLGRGSGAICGCQPGDALRILLPLGHGFSTDLPAGSRVLLVGGGVGIAPLLYLGKVLAEKGVEVEFLLGGRTAADILLQEEFVHYGRLHITTDDGSLGVHGMVTAHPRLNEKTDMLYCCGPLPMMKAVAAVAARNGVECEVSLENKMACGLGACLCCVEDTVEGNLCTCTRGPVFNINQLKWQI